MRTTSRTSGTLGLRWHAHGRPTARGPEKSKAIFVNGKVGINFMPDGSAYLAKQKAVPDAKLFWEGSLMAQEGWCVPKDAPNKDVAFAFIKWFAKQPKKQAASTKTNHHMTPAKNLTELIPPDVAAALPVGKKGVVVMDGQAAAPQAKEIKRTLKNVTGG